MLNAIADYKAPILDNNKLDYRLVAVHIPAGAGHYNGKRCNVNLMASVMPYRSHFESVFSEAHELFDKSAVQLRTGERKGIDKSTIEPLGEIVISEYGEINESDINKFRFGEETQNIVLVGNSFGNCHHRTFAHLIHHNVTEVHIPQDCTRGFSREEYPEESELYEPDVFYEYMFKFSDNPKIDVTKSSAFQSYLSVIADRSDYQVFVPASELPHVQELNGEKPPLLVVFHRSWKEMIEFFKEKSQTQKVTESALIDSEN